MHTKLLVIGEDVEGLMEPYQDDSAGEGWADTTPDLFGAWKHAAIADLPPDASAEEMCRYFTAPQTRSTGFTTARCRSTCTSTLTGAGSPTRSAAGGPVI